MTRVVPLHALSTKGCIVGATIGFKFELAKPRYIQAGTLGYLKTSNIWFHTVPNP